MKNLKKLFLGFILTALTIVSISGSALAAARDTVMKVEIPFEFYVKNEKMAAGQYELQKISERLYVLRGRKNGQKVLVATNYALSNKNSAATEKLVFNRYGSETFLREIYSNRTAEGQGWSESETEKKVRQGLENDDRLARGAKPKTVSVSLTK